ncbi:hypothetical protein F4777DRAFT_61644 [Nemania sp. FL0916]|nr:hypothetical protein F4777DRAFT_61644 [Nemania sp. FL0916]
MAMAMQRPHPRRLATFAICAVTLSIIWYKQLFTTLPAASRPVASSIINSFSPQLNNDGGRKYNTAIDLSSARAPFISWPLRRLCTEQQQVSASSDVDGTEAEGETVVPGLVFLCDSNSGGPGNIRNYILTCVRYAIAAGATGLQVPRIRARSGTDKANLFKNHESFGYMFSEAHFRSAMAEACPHIKLFPTISANHEDDDSEGDRGGGSSDSGDGYDLEAIPGVAAKAAREGIPASRMVRRITPKDYGGSRAGCDSRDPNRHTDRFGASFRRKMQETAAELGQQPPSWDNPMLVRLSWGVLWDWPVLRDGPEFAATFGGLLRIREDILDLADQVVRSMREFAAAAASEAERGGGGAGGKGQEKGKNGPDAEGRFLGVHLRTEEDALLQWPTYENQSAGYIQRAEKEGFRGGAAYLASGSETETRKFSDDARARLNLSVKSKYDLVQGPELDKLKSLSWDQQALVDFVVLLESDYFVGVSPSSFSINVALKRHLQKDGLYTCPWKVGSGDERSWLVGKYHSYWDDWLFMFDGMWP